MENTRWGNKDIELIGVKLKSKKKTIKALNIRANERKRKARERERVIVRKGWRRMKKTWNQDTKIFIN